MYRTYIKRPFDILCALAAIIVFSWLYIIVAVLVRVKLGSPVIFRQPRPGKDEKIFNLYKFRTMTDERDENGNLLPDDVRLTKFGRLLRKTSLDELPEAFNILKGDMSVVGPRPQLVRDMVFMTQEQRKRHTVRPGLSGLAQVKGRNGISWEEKLAYDLEYIKNITFITDIKLILMTVWTAFVKQEGINQEGIETAEDLGDYLLRMNEISSEEYKDKQAEVNSLINT
ncbi:MAG: sugar transferase [Eubacteriales bacterium]|nr:sugar transferase [Eubacteriales bacterium]